MAQSLDTSTLKPSDWQAIARAYMDDSPFGSRKDRITGQVGPSIRDVNDITKALQQDPASLSKYASKLGIQLDAAKPIDYLLGDGDGNDSEGAGDSDLPLVNNGAAPVAPVAQATQLPTTGTSAASDASQPAVLPTVTDSRVSTQMSQPTAPFTGGGESAVFSGGGASVESGGQNGAGSSATTSRGGDGGSWLDKLLGLAPLLAAAPAAKSVTQPMPTMPQLDAPATQQLLNAPKGIDGEVLPPQKAMPRTAPKTGKSPANSQALLSVLRTLALKP